MISYSFDPDYTIEGRHYAHPLVSWPTIIAGAVAAVAIGFLLNVLGLAIGASVFNPFQINHQDTAISVGSGLYMIFAQFVAMQAGGYIASRAARYPDHFGGALSGFLVWAFAVVVAVLIAAWTAGAVGSGDAIASGIAHTVGQVNDASEGQAASSSDLATASETADAVAAIAWWTVGALGLGLCGAVAGGWLGGHHPKWETRPRLDDRAAYKLSPEI